MDLKPKNVVMSKEWNAIMVDISGTEGTTDEWYYQNYLNC
jgi:hypothetical protein